MYIQNTSIILKHNIITNVYWELTICQAQPHIIHMYHLILSQPVLQITIIISKEGVKAQNQTQAVWLQSL